MTAAVWPLATDPQPVTILEARPAEALLPDGTLITRALVRLTRHAVYVWTEQGTSVALAYAATRTDPAEFVPSEVQLRQTPALVTVPEGTVTVNRGRGCGCGGVWRVFQPWWPDRRGAVIPLEAS